MDWGLATNTPTCLAIPQGSLPPEDPIWPVVESTVRNSHKLAFLGSGLTTDVLKVLFDKKGLVQQNVM